MENDIEIEEADAPCLSRGPHNTQRNGNATKSKPSQSCSTDTGHLSDVQEQRESSDDAERQGKDMEGNTSASFATDTTVSFPEENVAAESTGHANNGERVQQPKKNPDGDLPNEKHRHQDDCI